MTLRTRVVAGSLLGALAIHVVMLACSGPNRADDAGGVLDAVADALGMAGDAETRDANAQAQDGGGCACEPATRPASFYFTIDQAGTPTMAMSQYSTASAGRSEVRPVSGSPRFAMFMVGTAFLPGGLRVQLQCSASYSMSGGLVADGASCSMIAESTGIFQTMAVAGATGSLSDAEVTLRIPQIVMPVSGTVPDGGSASVTLRDVQFHGYGRGFLAIPSAYRRE